MSEKTVRIQGEDIDITELSKKMASPLVRRQMDRAFLVLQLGLKLNPTEVGEISLAASGLRMGRKGASKCLLTLFFHPVIGRMMTRWAKLGLAARTYYQMDLDGRLISLEKYAELNPVGVSFPVPKSSTLPEIAKGGVDPRTGAPTIDTKPEEMIRPYTFTSDPDRLSKMIERLKHPFMSRHTDKIFAILQTGHPLTTKHIEFLFNKYVQPKKPIRARDVSLYLKYLQVQEEFGPFILVGSKLGAGVGRTFFLLPQLRGLNPDTYIKFYPHGRKVDLKAPINEGSKVHQQAIEEELKKSPASQEIEDLFEGEGIGSAVNLNTNQDQIPTKEMKVIKEPGPLRVDNERLFQLKRLLDSPYCINSAHRGLAFLSVYGEVTTRLVCGALSTIRGKDLRRQDIAHVIVGAFKKYGPAGIIERGVAPGRGPGKNVFALTDKYKELDFVDLVHKADADYLRHHHEVTEKTTTFLKTVPREVFEEYRRRLEQAQSKKKIHEALVFASVLSPATANQLAEVLSEITEKERTSTQVAWYLYDCFRAYGPSGVLKKRKVDGARTKAFEFILSEELADVPAGDLIAAADEMAGRNKKKKPAKAPVEEVVEDAEPPEPPGIDISDEEEKEIEASFEDKEWKTSDPPSLGDEYAVPISKMPELIGSLFKVMQQQQAPKAPSTLIERAVTGELDIPEEINVTIKVSVITGRE